MIKIAPSLLAADFGHIHDEIERMAAAGADYLHYDVMDGNFVPNITFGQGILKAAAKCSLPVDAHLMIDRPEQYIDQFAAGGAKIITVHAEATVHLHRALQQIRAAGCLAGVALNPGTSPDCLRYVLSEVDLVLVMTVNPGFGGQKFIPGSLRKIRQVKAMCDERHVNPIIEVDGGISPANAADVCAAGARLLVAGSAFFGKADRASAIREITEAGESGLTRRA